MTPLHIDILIHYHVSSTEYGKEFNNFDAPAVKDAINWMIGANLIEAEHDVACERAYRTTDKGAFYIDAICNLPLPQKRMVWEIPRAHTDG